MMIETLKASLVLLTGLTRDALHTYLGLAIFFATAFVLRRSPSSWVPLLCVFGVALLNESIDYWDDLARLGHWRRHLALFDFFSVVFWPTVIMLMTRFGVVLRKQ
jgi:hypothetical protein